jgi:hypothetical protein
MPTLPASECPGAARDRSGSEGGRSGEAENDGGVGGDVRGFASETG